MIAVELAEFKWGDPDIGVKLGQAAKAAAITSSSKVELLRHEDFGAIEIQLHGELARVPNLKNRKQPVTLKDGRTLMLLNKDIMAKLHAMDACFQAAESRTDGPWCMPAELNLIVGVVAATTKGAALDIDAYATSVLDWLEPATKGVVRGNEKLRGWGVGVIANDRLVKAVVTLQAGHVTAPCDFTRIIVGPMPQSEIGLNKFMKLCLDKEGL